MLKNYSHFLWCIPKINKNYIKKVLFTRHLVEQINSKFKSIQIYQNLKANDKPLSIKISCYSVLSSNTLKK